MTLSRHRLLSLVFAVAFVAAACTSSDDVETAPTTEADTEAAEGVDESDADDDEVAVGEDDAMGEDEGTEDLDDGADGEDDAGENETDDAIEEPADDEGDDETGAAASGSLAGAVEAAAADDFGLPFVYARVDQDCDGCVPSADLYYSPDTSEGADPLDRVLAGVYVDGVEQPLTSVHPVLAEAGVLAVAETLVARGAADGDVGLDPLTGIVTSFETPEGSVRITCLQVDTRPVDMRDPACSGSLIG